MKIRLGVDIACRAAHQASCADERGEMLFVGHRFHTDPDELDTLWARLPQDCEVTVVMEPTRNAWVALAAWFRRHGASVVMVPPEQSADLRSYYNKHAKTDRLDSRVLARLPRPGPKSRQGERHCLSARSQEATRLIARGRGVERARRRGHQGRRGIRTPRCSHRPLGQSQLGEQLKRAADRPRRHRPGGPGRGEVREQGRTVFLSSHTLSEVERVADRVGIIRHGRLVVVERIETLKRKAISTLDFVFGEDIPADIFDGVPGTHDVEIDGAHATVSYKGSVNDVLAAAMRHEVVELHSRDSDLEEIFLTYYRDTDPDEVSANGPRARTADASAADDSTPLKGASHVG